MELLGPAMAVHCCAWELSHPCKQMHPQHSCWSLESVSCGLTGGFLAAQSVSSAVLELLWFKCQPQRGALHCRKTFAAIPVSKAVMCQALWQCLVHLPKICTWKGCGECALLDKVVLFHGFCLVFQNDNKGFIKENIFCRITLKLMLIFRNLTFIVVKITSLG